VEREHFNSLLVNYTCLTEQEALDLAVLTDAFPFSQVIRNLAARGAQDADLPSKEKMLHLSAIYSTDRQALKEVMTSPRQNRIEVVYPEDITEAPNLLPAQESDDLRNQLAIDLAKLKESRLLFESTLERLEKEKALPLAEKKVIPLEPETGSNETLIEEIKSSKKKIKPEGEKQKEQIEIIDQFIKTQPAISRPKPTLPVQDNDLSEPSGQFGENIVSETLVEILLKQGKKERAIEALKKLIWKFPQKKAYFAAQIEELRK
jgi:antitoxin component of RelBE/YafQ-DinJ toxin-antitoxin module